jgi:hypothetical protein
MSGLDSMNLEMLEIWKNYLDLCAIFNERLEDIQANEILNINLELLKASITDLNINLANFKDEIEEKRQPRMPIIPDISSASNQSNQSIQSNDINYVDETEVDKKKMLALFFLYLMRIDKDSILNNSHSHSHSYPNCNANECDNTNATKKNKSKAQINGQNKIKSKTNYNYEDPELD